MRKHLAIIAAASLTVGGLALQVTGEERDVGRPGYTQSTLTQTKVTLPAGITQKEADNAEAIRDVLGQVAETSMTKGGFDDLVERLVDADRNRIGNYAEEKFETLDGRIAQLQKAFHDKYNVEFDIKDEEKVFKPEMVAIVQGEITNPALLANWPLEQKTMGTGAGGTDKPATKPAGEGTVKENVAGGGLVRDADTPADRNLDKGREVAVLLFPASHNLPELRVSLIREMPANWRIDIPTALTARNSTTTS
jgi:hypothetical protein